MFYRHMPAGSRRHAVSHEMDGIYEQVPLTRANDEVPSVNSFSVRRRREKGAGNIVDIHIIAQVPTRAVHGQRFARQRLASQNA